MAGNPKQVPCPSCAAPNAARNRFCWNCSRTLGIAARQGIAPPYGAAEARLHELRRAWTARGGAGAAGEGFGWAPVLLLIAFVAMAVLAVFANQHWSWARPGF